MNSVREPARADAPELRNDWQAAHEKARRPMARRARSFGPSGRTIGAQRVLQIGCVRAFRFRTFDFILEVVEKLGLRFFLFFIVPWALHLQEAALAHLHAQPQKDDIEALPPLEALEDGCACPHDPVGTLGINHRSEVGA